MMLCKFKTTPYVRRKDGRPLMACSRAGCSQVAFAETPEQVVGNCRHPYVRFLLGDAFALLVKIVTLGLLKEKPGCGCQKRRKRWNNWLQMPLPNFAYKCLLWLGLRSQAERRIDKLLRLYRIVPKQG